jgi:hypothetical protein
MMSTATDLQISATDRTPEIHLSASTGLFSMKGESYPEDVAAFYGQVVHAVEQLPSSLTKPLEADISMIYINSSSIKAMFRIFEGFEAVRRAGQPVTVRWHYTDDDDIMQELGEDFKDRFPELSIEIKAN